MGLMKNYLDNWIIEKITGAEIGKKASKEGENLPNSINVYEKKEAKEYRRLLEEYQLTKIKESIKYACENSKFYKDHLGEVSRDGILKDCGQSRTIEDFNQNIASKDFIQDITLDSFKKIPFLNSKDCNEKLLCVSQSQIERVVTVNSSGTTGAPKRVYFTEEDQELTVDFFHRGMENIIDKDDTLLILMPSKTPTSIGELLKNGVERIGARVVAKGMLKAEESYEELLELIVKEEITSIVAMPMQMEEIIKAYRNFSKKFKLKSILLSAEYVPERLLKNAEKTFSCYAYEHFGMTETGYGGAVSCFIREGYHTREADLYIEIIDPKTGEVLEDGKWGEIVITTLTRKAMPLIRYRTGDVSRWLVDPCPCGSFLKRLDKVKDRNQKKGDEFYVK